MIIKVPEYIENLKAYVPGKAIEEIKKDFGLSEIHKLASNENPLGPSPKAVEAMLKSTDSLNRYPDVGALDLRNKLSQKFKIDINNIVVGSGSEGIMATILRSFLCENDELITSDSTFIGFQVLARGRANKTHFVDMSRADYKFNLNGILAKINDNTKIIYLCNPNNPTGTIFTKAEFNDFIKQVPESVIVIMDEAYFEYAQGHLEYPDSMLYKYENIITLRTFSKIYGIAGIRIGYGFAHKDIISILMKVKLPFEPNNLAQAGALAALDDDEFLIKSIELNEKGYDYFTTELEVLQKQGKLKWFPSFANFILLDLEKQERVDFINRSLLKEGVIIRPLIAFGLPHCLRVTIGLEEENQTFIKALKKII